MTGTGCRTCNEVISREIVPKIRELKNCEHSEKDKILETIVRELEVQEDWREYIDTEDGL